jgi:Mg-chelatase subunit ChlI
MSKARLVRMSNAELVELFRGYAIMQQRVLLNSNTSKYNKLYDKMAAIDAELRSRGIEARRSLLTLLSDENFRVRYAAAMKSLGVERDRAIAVLREIAASHMMPEAGDAGMALFHLERGIFKPT